MSNTETIKASYCTPFGIRKGTLKEALDYATMAYDASGFKTTIWAFAGPRIPFRFDMHNKAVLV